MLFFYVNNDLPICDRASVVHNITTACTTFPMLLGTQQISNDIVELKLAPSICFRCELEVDKCHDGKYLAEQFVFFINYISYCRLQMRNGAT